MMTQYGLPGVVVSDALQVPPTVLAAVSGASGEIDLTWNAASGAATYSLYRGLTTGAESPTPVATGLTGTSTTDTGLTPGLTYYYYLRALGSNGTSFASNEAHAAAGA